VTVGRQWPRKPWKDLGANATGLYRGPCPARAPATTDRGSKAGLARAEEAAGGAAQRLPAGTARSWQ